MDDPEDLASVGQRIEALLDGLQADVGPEAFDRVEELVGLVSALHGAGLRRLLARLEVAAPTALDDLRSDDVVAGLLAIHGLAPAVPVEIGPKPASHRHGSGGGARCDLCAEPIDEGHGHLVDLEQRSLACACRPCHLLFTQGGAGGHRFRAVPDRYVTLPDGTLTPPQWDALQIPVRVAFVFRNSDLGRVVAFYPSPAGATESELPLDAWEEVAAAHPALDGLVADVEAVLLHRPRGGSGVECHIVPIDVCYELVGRLRSTWRGFDGGTEANAALDEILTRVAERATPVPVP